MSVEPDSNWSIIEAAFDVRNNRHFEGLLAIGSGPLQQRACLEEGLSDDPQDREYLRRMGNVSVETFPAFKGRYGTYLPGVTGPHPTCGDELINLPAIHCLVLYAGQERLDMERSRVADYRRWLDLRSGRLHRELTWQTQRGAVLRVEFERFISAQRRHVMALRVRVRHLDGPPVELRFVSAIDADVRTNGFDHFEQVSFTGEHEPITVELRTNGGQIVAGAALVTCEPPVPRAIATERRWAAVSGARMLEPGQVLTVFKYVALVSSHHVSGPPVDAARNLVWAAAAAGFDQLARESDAVWQRRWEQTNVEIIGDPHSEHALRVGLYHLLRAAVEDDPRVAIDPRGYSGEAYCGRYFWDTEIFILPLFLYTRPEVGRTLASFRLESLAGARRNAARYGYPGARYAWESSPAGDEHCPNWQYADHEVHVTADVAWGLWHAYRACPDPRFLVRISEALTEMARYWAQRVSYCAQADQFELLGVMGPDEYTLFSRNNAYTNYMTARAFTFTQQAWKALQQTDPQTASALARSLRLTPSELEFFEQIARKLRRPYDPSHNLVLQADDFFALEHFDFERWWPDRSRPLGACVPQERLYRSQVLKQADVLLLMALLPDEFSREQVLTAYRTYTPLTCHDSSLSRCVHALVAARLALLDQALQMWDQSVSLDLHPPAAAEGVHAGCAGGNWQAAVFGFAGLHSRMESNLLQLQPHLPPRWSAVRFPLVWCGQPLHVSVETDRVVIEHRGSQPLKACILGQMRDLTPGDRHEFA
jgi:trehalose/maltose hydrolase-like predicted phosphorylase